MLVGMCEIVIPSNEKQFMYERANEKKERRVLLELFRLILLEIF